MKMFQPHSKEKAGAVRHQKQGPLGLSLVENASHDAHLSSSREGEEEVETR